MMAGHGSGGVLQRRQSSAPAAALASNLATKAELRKLHPAPLEGMGQRLGSTLATAVATAALVAILGGCTQVQHRGAASGSGAGAGASAGGRSDGRSAGAGGGPIDPCGLATRDEINGTLGQPAETPQTDDRGMLTACTVWSQGHERYLVILLPPGDVEAGRPGLDWTRPRFDSYCADKHTARAVSGVGDAACFVLGKDSGELIVVKNTFAVSCYLWFDDARQRPAEDALLSTLRTLAAAIVSRR